MDQENCTWSEGVHGEWISSCGRCFVFGGGTPAENGAKYCLFCGGELIVNEYDDEGAKWNWKKANGT